MKKYFEEFGKFIQRGDVLNLAVGVIIGGAFQAIVNSLVNDIISPIIGLVFKADFSELVIKVGEVDIKYGAFITAIINFIIMAFVIFAIVKAFNNLQDASKKKQPAVEEKKTTKICPYCKSEINIEAVKCPHCTSTL